MTTQETFGDYVNSLPVATLINPSDQLYLRQSGASKQLPASLLPSGGGGISNFSVVATISALAALSIPSGTFLVIVLDTLRGGTFVWNGGTSVTALVTNDPGQGTTVAPNADTTGASGAWIRQGVNTVDFAWWGAINNGVVTDPWNLSGSWSATGTDNTQAFVNWNKWARWQSSLGIAVTAQPTAGTYLYDGSGVSGTGFKWLSGIRDLTILGNKSFVIQNTYNTAVHGANFAFSSPIPTQTPNTVTGYLVQQTTPTTSGAGPSTFTLINSGDAVNFAVGMSGFLGSLDKQYLGYPYNLQQFEYFTVIGKSGTTITIEEAIKYQHRTDYPDYSFTSSPCGAGRAWLFNPLDAWDGTHIYDGIQVNLPPGGGQTYATLSKLNLITRNYVGCGFSETLFRNIVHYNPILRTPGEIDKLGHYLEYNNPQGLGFGIACQSACPNILMVNGGRIDNATGFAKRSVFRGVTIGTVAPGAQYGLAGDALFQVCDVLVDPSTSLGSPVDGAILNTIDGTNVRWALPGTFVGSITGSVLTLTSVSTGTASDILGCPITGTNVAVFTNVLSLASGTLGAAGSTYNLSTSTGTASGSTITIGNTGVLKINLAALGFNASLWGLVPGMYLNLQATASGAGNFFSNDIGTGFVVSYTWDGIGVATAVTTLPYSSTPSWATGNIYLIKNGEIAFENCTGNDAVRNGSDAKTAGTRYFEYKRIPFGGNNGQSMFVASPAGVQLISVQVYVQNPSSVGTARLTMGFATIQTPAMTLDSGGTVLTINLGVAGTRTIDQNQWTGIQTSDALTVGGSSASVLPSGRLLGSIISLQFFTEAPSEGQSPEGEIILQYSAGIVKKRLTRQYDDSGTISPAHAILPIQGILP